MRQLSRTGLGPHFSEGNRLLWVATRKRKIGHTQLAEMLGIKQNTAHRYMYGDRKLPLDLMLRVQKLFPSVRLPTFAVPPTRPFAPPGLERAS